VSIDIVGQLRDIISFFNNRNWDFLYICVPFWLFMIKMFACIVYDAISPPFPHVDDMEIVCLHLLLIWETYPLHLLVLSVIVLLANLDLFLVHAPCLSLFCFVSQKIKKQFFESLLLVITEWRRWWYVYFRNYKYNTKSFIFSRTYKTINIAEEHFTDNICWHI
jgi:hypothetical protein